MTADEQTFRRRQEIIDALEEAGLEAVSHERSEYV
jgi:hypothetical protein